MNEIPDWVKTGGFIMFCMIIWDIVRLFLQALVNRWMMRFDFKKIEDGLEDVEEAIEEDTNGQDKNRD